MVDLPLAKTKLLTAIASTSTGMESDDILRPSTCGNCPRRQWLDAHSQKEKEVRELKYSWYAFQGTLTEAALRPFLRMAGAEVLDPPTAEERERPNAPNFRSELDMLPHVDGAIRWEEVGIDEWALLEFKALRATASIDIILNGVQYARDNWYQAVAYLMQAKEAVQNAGWAIDIPRQLMFFLAPKDASTVQMLIGGRTKTTIKEREHPEKMKPEEIERAQKKAHWRGRLEEIGDLVFYMEMIRADDPRVLETWEEIKELPGMLRQDEAPPPLHDPLLEPDELDVECAAYCAHWPCLPTKEEEN